MGWSCWRNTGDLWAEPLTVQMGFWGPDGGKCSLHSQWGQGADFWLPPQGQDRSLVKAGWWGWQSENLSAGGIHTPSCRGRTGFKKMETAGSSTILLKKSHKIRGPQSRMVPQIASNLTPPVQRHKGPEREQDLSKATQQAQSTAGNRIQPSCILLQGSFWPFL